MSEFTVQEKLALSIGLTEETNDEASKTLRKIIDTFPWLVTVAECKFDPDVVNAGVIAAAQIETAKMIFSNAVKKYQEKEREYDTSK